MGGWHVISLDDFQVPIGLLSSYPTCSIVFSSLLSLLMIQSKLYYLYKGKNKWTRGEVSSHRVALVVLINERRNSDARRVHTILRGLPHPHPVRLNSTPFTSSQAHPPHPHHIASSPRSPSLGWHCRGWLRFIVVLPPLSSLGWNHTRWVGIAHVGLNLPSLG